MKVKIKCNKNWTAKIC